MPTLNWIGKEAVVKHHKEVPFRLLEPVPELSCGDANSGNLIVQGDSWLSMMYPRLVLLKKFLREDGAIFVSIDDNEVGNLQALMREVFGSTNEVATIVWEKGKKGDSKLVSVTHEYIVAFARNKALLKERKVRWRPGIDAVLEHYQSLRKKHGDDHAAIRKEMMAWYRALPKGDPRKGHKHYNWSDKRGLYFPDNFHGPDDGRENRPRYPILHPVTQQPCAMPSTGWRWEEDTTKAALAEGWDCPFAYILVSMASLSSATAVEQLLGRVLRQPGASHRQAKALNQSYAFVVSRNFAETAGALRDRLVAGAGFERREVTEFVTAAKAEQARRDLEGHAGRIVVRPVAITLTEKPDLKSVPKPVRDKVSWDGKLNTLTISTPLTEDEAEVLKASVSSETAAAAIVEAAEISRTTAIEFFQTPAELGERFRIPQLALKVQGELQLFDDPEVLEYPWDLSTYDAAPTGDDLTALGAGLKVSEDGEIDVDDESGKVVSRFLPDLQRDLGLVYQPENWDEVRLATWLCRNQPEPSLTHASKQAFVAKWLTELLLRDGFTLARANLQKFLIRNLLEARIRDLRKQAVRKAFQQTLFGDDAASRVAVTDQYAFEFHAQAYAPSRDYDGRFGHFDFRKHFYGRIGDFDSKEEFECACWLDIQAQQGHIQFWVRNLVRREGSSFFLQKADGRFYPDFLCQLPGSADKPGPILAVEYKGADRWAGAEDDRLIGGLWANLSEGRCRFVMVKDKRWEWIEGCF
jgi:hypothetical protein